MSTDNLTCDWPVDETCLPALTDEQETERVALDAARDLAIDVLWALSGRQYGVCPTVVRPCPMSYLPNGRLGNPYGGGMGYGDGYMAVMWSGDGTSGNWYNVACGCGGRCMVSGPRMAHLPGPAQSIIEVKIANTVLDPSQYVLEKNILYRKTPDDDGDFDGNGSYSSPSSWPAQDLSRPAGEEGTWTVTYMKGFPVPKGVARLTGLLVNEFYQACTGGKCRLPRTVTEVSRQGVTYRSFNPHDIYQSGKVGIPEIDLWLAAVNPRALLGAPSVL